MRGLGRAYWPRQEGERPSARVQGAPREAAWESGWSAFQIHLFPKCKKINYFLRRRNEETPSFGLKRGLAGPGSTPPMRN